MSENRYFPLAPSIFTLVYAGAVFQGKQSEEFRILTQVSELSGLLEPFWCGTANKVIFQGRIPPKTSSIGLRLAIEPNSNAFSLGGSIQELSIDLWCAEYPASGKAISAPIRLRTTESLITQPQDISVQFEFRWHLHTPIEAVLATVMDHAMTRSGLYGIRILARRIWDAQHTLHHPSAQHPAFSAEDCRSLHTAISQLYFAYVMRAGGTWDFRPALKVMYGSTCIDLGEGLLYEVEDWNAFLYGYLAASAGFTEDQVLAIPDLSDAFSQLESIGLRDITDSYLQGSGEGWMDALLGNRHLQAELLRIGHVLERGGIQARADLSIPNALGLGFDLGKSMNGRKMPKLAAVLALVRDAGFPAMNFVP